MVAIALRPPPRRAPNDEAVELLALDWPAELEPDAGEFAADAAAELPEAAAVGPDGDLPVALLTTGALVGLAGELVAATPVLTGSAEALTGREQEVLDAVAEGLSNRMIALRLSISPNTVRTHISSMLGKLGLENRTQLALYARERLEQG